MTVATDQLFCSLDKVKHQTNAMDVNFHILAEALSTLIGQKVILKSEVLDTDDAVQLDVTNLPAAVLLSDEAKGLWAYLTSLLRRLLDLDEVQTRDANPGASQDANPGGTQDAKPGATQDANSVPTKTPRIKSARPSGRKVLFVIPEEFFDPAYDFDFTHKSKSKSDSDCKRGNEPYKRPYGWKRFALKVRDKYPDGKAWLGTGGWRNKSTPNEWPVSYHGTSLEGAEGVVKTHYKAGDREVHGRGIYSTPDIKVADGYARSKQFTSQKNGKTYKVIMQKRIHPEKRTFTEEKDYWLVPIPAGSSPAKEKEIVESSIRPYGILLKEVKDGQK
ncbi:hypothetical protein IRJ41_005153 [Triplophysa rosa]|uniref:Uncharacterized protein n=1 Tax=Triplophysa rosa TaxID=992332 RepID=A0A9W7T6H4_TRIRA|nr:hypothetical protein IRJ41_005153 [Triplophysa rosa]